MGRMPRIAAGGIVYHVLNRANARAEIFDSDGDYAAFLGIVARTLEIVPMRVVEYTLMPNHWHLVLWPVGDRDLSRFMHELANTHVKRWAAVHGVTGTGHLYQGRFKSFPIQDDRHYLNVCRYVARNPLRARLVPRAENWKWSSLHQRLTPDAECPELLSEGPLELPRKWLEIVNEPQPDKDVTSIRQCIRRGRPYGSEDWVARTAARLGLESTLRDRGRPRLR